LRLLRQRACQQDELALAARDHGVGSRCKLRDTELLEHPCCHHAIVRGRPAEEIAVRGAAHQHHGLYGEGEGRHVRLRHIGDESRALADRDAGEGATTDGYLTGLRREDAEQRLEQRRLAAAVRA
jgi:hypothetical protein